MATTYLIAARAHSTVADALRRKKLFKQPCEVCHSTTNVQAHHDDYAKPLEVRWLCVKHHRQWHSKNGSIMNRWTVINIRDVPDGLVSMVKLSAIDKRMTMRDWVIETLWEASKKYAKRVHESRLEKSIFDEDE